MGIDKQKIWMGVGILFFVGVIAFFVGYMVASQQEMVGKAISDKHISSVKKISNVETVCNDGIDNNNNDLIDCADPDCAGKPSGDGNICCMTNKDCSKFKGTNCNANYCENSEQCQDRCKQEKDFCSLGGSIPLVCGKGYNECTAKCPKTTETEVSTPSCGAGLTKCGNVCVNISININNCGGCDQKCNLANVSGSAIVDCAQGVCKATGCLTGYKFNSSSGTCVQKCGDGKCDEATEGYDSDKKEIICMKDCGCKGPSTDEINLFLKGTVSGIQYSSKKWITASDSCNGTDKVNKQYCIIKGDNSYALYAISKCPSGSECKEGACVKSTPAVILGDVDGDNTLTTFDAVLVLRHVVGDATLTPDQQTKANVNSCENGGEALDSFDAVLILRKFVGEITKFPCE